MENTPRDQVLSFLKKMSVMALSVNAEPWPISTVLLYAVDDDMNIYFVTHRDSFKSKALMKDNRVSLSVWKYDEMMVQASGRVMEMNRSETPRILDMLVESSGRLSNFLPPVLRIQGSGYVIYRITLEWIRKLDMSTQTIRSSQNLFDEIK